MNDLLIQMAVSILLSTIKNPEKRAELKRAMLKVRNTINMAYADDPDFWPVVEVEPPTPPTP
jgi:hypothetical protein